VEEFQNHNQNTMKSLTSLSSKELQTIAQAREKLELAQDLFNETVADITLGKEACPVAESLQHIKEDGRMNGCAPRKRKPMSPAGRAAIAAATKKRWRKWRKGQASSAKWEKAKVGWKKHGLNIQD
jgi:hypothetical protein